MCVQEVSPPHMLCFVVYTLRVHVAKVRAARRMARRGSGLALPLFGTMVDFGEHRW